MDWDDLKFVLAIARHGSLSAAAGALGTTQPTVSRRLNSLERSIGVKLFERGPAGLLPTRLCESLVDSLAQMEARAHAVERRIAARDTGLEGPITVTSLGWFGDDILAPLLARFGARHPEVTIELINDPRRFNLFRREADIAVRVGAFEERELVQRTVAQVSYGLYASADYLACHGRPDFTDGCSSHRIASLVETPSKVVHIEWLNDIAPKARAIIRTNGIQSHFAIVEAGQAVAVLPHVLALRRSTLVRVEPPKPEPRQPVRLGVHPDMRHSPRIRALIDFLVDELQRRALELDPGEP